MSEMLALWWDDTNTFTFISAIIYLIGLVLWFALWRALIGYEWLKRERMMRLPLWGCVVALTINLILTLIAEVPEYGVEIGIYSFVEVNAKTVALFTLGIAVFVVVTFRAKAKMLTHQESRKFLQLVFSSFLLAVVGVLPLYWVPQIWGWLTVLRHLKTVPFLYSLFVLAAAIIVFLHEIKGDTSPLLPKGPDDADDD
jgi:hypothetical protein